MPELPLREESLSPSVPRSAPLGNLWATEDDPVSTGFAKSQEFALDSLLPDWKGYQSWPNYPDDRNLPVGEKARDAWAKRRPLRLAELARLGAVKTVTAKPPEPVTKPLVTKLPVTNLCPVCQTFIPEKLTGRPATYCSPNCRVAANRKR